MKILLIFANIITLIGVFARVLNLQNLVFNYLLILGISLSIFSFIYFILQIFKIENISTYQKVCNSFMLIISTPFFLKKYLNKK